MYIAPENGFVFMHINKTGGRSLVQFFREHIPRLYSPGLHLVHKPYEKIKHLMPKGFSLVTIIRDPRERYESLYSYRLLKYDRGDLSEQCIQAHCLPFNDWFPEQFDSDNILDLPQEQWFCGMDLDSIFFLRLEYIKDDLAKIISLFDIKVEPGWTYPHLNKSPREPIQWNEENTELIDIKERYLYTNYYKL
ncbi:MAG: hypothetical protein KAS39_01300 [Actinomycetia bacterium]|nr:hypothetical protein [Actinomycetes bacterium]